MSEAHGVLFPQRPQGNSPNWTGEIDLTPELIAEIAANPGFFRLRIVGWNKKSGKGNDYMSLALRADQNQEPKPPRQPQSQQAGSYPQPRPQAPRAPAPRIGPQQPQQYRPQVGPQPRPPTQHRPGPDPYAPDPRQRPQFRGQQPQQPEFDDNVNDLYDDSAPWK